MTPDLLFKQLESYSNAIVAFAVLQGLAFSYAFGNNSTFNCTVKNAPHLAEGLAIAFVVLTFLLLAAIVWLGRAMESIAGEFVTLVKKLYLGKLVAVALFSLLPLCLILYYGVRDYPGKTDCKAAIHAAT
ncbi:MAG: hypothetical protein H6R12_1205 [Proteobacteria bacterium]|jgi:hypothetical protein|nr:hypothetical protein [Pseudomonadota bacterium]